MRSVAALDIGSSAIAGAELRVSRDRVALRRAAVEPLPPGLVRDGEVVDPGGLAAEIRRFWRAGRFSGRRVRLGVANQRVVVRAVDVPILEDDGERRAAVEIEAAERVPVPLERAVLDHLPVLRFPGPDGERERHVVVAAHREMIEGLVATVREAGLQPVGIDLEAFAILRALVPPPAVVDEGSADGLATAVCHIGAEVTSVIVAVDGLCHFTRLVGFGGRALTDAVAERAGVPPEEAEALKIACGLLGPAVEGWDAETVAAARHAMALAARPLAREVARSLDYYRSLPLSRPIGRLVLGGGTALCAGLDRYLGQALGIPAEHGDPRSQLDEGAALDAETAARASVAVGLALDAPGAR